MICANRDEPDVGRWSMYARDAFVMEAGRLFGMQIREIHPPEAARGLDTVAEFDQHFDASYRPLIHRGLEHNQPVLAWQGWPGDRGLSWGIIRDKCGQGVGFRGVTMWSDAEILSSTSLTLTRPPIQLYVVERITAIAPRDVELLDVALDHARTALGGGLGDRFGVITGPSAFDEWIARLSYPIRAASESEGSTWPVAGAPGSDRHAANIIAACESAIRFLQKHGPAAPADQSAIAPLLIAEAETIAGALREFLRTVETEPSDASAMLVERLPQVRSAAGRTQALLRSFATPRRDDSGVARRTPTP
jgi:hypothetical protein